MARKWNMERMWRRLKGFALYGVWKEKEGEGGLERMWRRLLRVVIATVREFVSKKPYVWATSLAFDMVMSVVPVVALLLAVAQGFGFQAQIEKFVLDVFAVQPTAAEAILDFSKSYLSYNRGYGVLGWGIVLMVYAVFMLIRDVEDAFSEIWSIRKSRSMKRKLVDYIAMIFIVPVVIVLLSGVLIFTNGIADRLLSPLQIPQGGGFPSEWHFSLFTLHFSLASLLVVLSVAFTAFYIFIPNTKVKFLNALVSGVLSSFCIIVLQNVYIKVQVMFTSYSAVYGSLSALPLLLLWLQLSWMVFLFFGQLCYVSQNHWMLTYFVHTYDISHNYRMRVCCVMLRTVCQRFGEKKLPMTAREIRERVGLTAFPQQVVCDLLRMMADVGLLNELYLTKGDDEARYQPAFDLEQMTLGEMIERMEMWRKNQYRSFALAKMKGENKRVLDEYEQVYERFLEELRKIRVAPSSSPKGERSRPDGNPPSFGGSWRGL